MKPIGRTFTFWIVGAMALVALLAPTSNAVAQGTGTVTAQARYCTVLSYQGVLGDVGADCTPGPATFTFYLHGDGTDESWTLNVPDSGDASIDLAAGEYDVWTPGGPIFTLIVPESGSTPFAYGFPVAAPEEPTPPTEPAPTPEMATLNVNTYECTGVTGAPIALGEVGPDCTRVATNLDFYLWGDGTDDSWNLSTSNTGPVAIDLQVGGYDVVNTMTWATLGTQLPSGGATLNIGYAAEAAPSPPPAPETAVLNVNTYACTGVVGAPIALVDIGPDCTRIATNLDFYLWGDGTDDSWNLTTSATEAVSIELQVGGYQVVDTATWEQLGAQLPSGGATLNIGFAAVAPVETGMVSVSTYECTGLDSAGVLNEIGPDCTPTGGDFTFYLWGDGTDDHAWLQVDASGMGSIELPVGSYEVVEENTQVRMQIEVTADGTVELAFGYPAS